MEIDDKTKLLDHSRGRLYKEVRTFLDTCLKVAYF